MDSLILRLMRFQEDRQWKKYHTPKELARAIIIEAGELNNEFIWGKEYDIELVKSEMADIFIFLTYLSIALDCDLIREAHKKIDKNAQKYPVKDSINKW